MHLCPVSKTEAHLVAKPELPVNGQILKEKLKDLTIIRH